MHWPPPIRVVLSSSHLALGLIAALALASCGVIATLAETSVNFPFSL